MTPFKGLETLQKSTLHHQHITQSEYSRGTNYRDIWRETNNWLPRIRSLSFRRLLNTLLEFISFFLAVLWTLKTYLCFSASLNILIKYTDANVEFWWVGLDKISPTVPTNSICLYDLHNQRNIVKHKKWTVFYSSQRAHTLSYTHLPL